MFEIFTNRGKDLYYMFPWHYSFKKNPIVTIEDDTVFR